jgi:hypothetical protein
MAEGLENHNILHTFIKNEMWDDKNKEFNKVEAAEIGFVTSLHECTEI